ncbi:DUF1963 domain-containing protein [Parerythrobacter lacustris]|uniref:DUF1963 domain-containing protein n=1 Tax=Parerythrobacter lacustris TaxID=2969984 RepID=A0ABT1XP15_9SPHN|nr:DUF1963 domain-containing protein [Parerythrobacter lacustris]MCR2833410.1 DUF1963 domain-containing protein [Parerythrobacter lacustris]
MSLAYALVPVALIAVAWLAIRVFAGWADKRRGRREQLEAEAAEAIAAPVVRKRGLVAEASDAMEPGMADSAVPPAAPPAPAPVSAARGETVSAVLRRQVPPRDEAPRSWLGGLPMMPDGVEWPRAAGSEYPEKGERPLHFLAQIACEDLPPDLWGGIGPRTGWLLFFIDPNSCTAEAEGDRAVIHTPELGTERAPPADLGPVHDKVYTGGSYNWLGADEVPNVWRRWPVDIVQVANRLTQREGYKTASPDDFAQVLYQGAPVAKENRPSGLPVLRPQTFAQARAAVEALARSLRYKVRDGVDARAREPLLADDGKDRLMAHLHSQIERIEADSDAPLSEQRAKTHAFVTRIIAEFEPLDAQQIIEHIGAIDAKRIAWREKVAGLADRIAALLAEHGDAELAAEHWEELQATFADKRLQYVELGYRDWGDKPDPFILLGPSDTAALVPPKGMNDIAVEYYLDPEQRHRLPDDFLAAHQPVWRTLYNNRPHRMGGYHDGLQSEPIEDPEWRNMLLLQIATDIGMDWCWGDSGAYYFWIKPEHLARGDFSGTEVWLECH